MRPTRQGIANRLVRLAGHPADYPAYPPDKVTFHMRTCTWCRSRAEQTCERIAE